MVNGLIHPETNLLMGVGLVWICRILISEAAERTVAPAATVAVWVLAPEAPPVLHLRSADPVLTGEL